MAQHDDQEAIYFFKQAHLVEPSAEEPLRYLSMLNPSNEVDYLNESTASTDDTERAYAIFDALDQFQAATAIKAKIVFEPGSGTAAPSAGKIMQSAKAASIVHGADKKENAPIDVITVDDILKANPQKPTVRVAFQHSVIIEGKDIEKFLVIDPLFIAAKQVSRDRIQIDGKLRGGTFLHIWDVLGRKTIYIEVILPIITLEDMALAEGPVEHAAPFRLKYSNDWTSYYTGPQVSDLRRRGLTFYEQVGTEGQTPYGNMDASASLTGFNPIKSVPTYTVGLAQVPVPGTRDLNVRLFDALRGQSSLTLPSMYLRGQFVDVNLFQDAVGLAVTHGQLQPIFGGFSLGSARALKSYVNGFRMILFPKDKANYLALNYAESYGSDRSPSVANKAYSIEGTRTIDKVTLNAELARNDASHNAAMGGIKWKNGAFQTAVSARDISRSYATVIGSGSAQGEIGALWTTDTDLEKLSVNTIIDVYQNRIYFNPENPNGQNFDTTAMVRIPLNKRYMVDMNAHYVDTQQDLSPRRNTQVTTRLMRSLDVWGGRVGSVYTGMVRQRVRYAESPLSEYDRTSAITGMQLPLLTWLSYNANYEYTWLSDTFSGERSNPGVFYTGLSAYSSFNDKTSGNFNLTYRKEKNFKSINSFLAGEDSLSASAGVDYRPNKDVSYFLDGGVRKVWPKALANPSYNDMDVHCGMRMNWGMPLSWDPEGVVSGVVFKDMDADGVKKSEEKGIAGVKIKVGDKEVVTDAQGQYKVNVRAKKVLVRPVFESLPSGFSFSTATSYRIVIRPGQVNRADFGLTTSSGIYGVAFVDKNGNNLPDKGDEFVPKVRVVLDGKLRLLTDNRGVYFFRNIAEGRHVLTLDMKEMPSKYIPLIKLKNEIDLGEGVTYTLHIPLKMSESKPAE
ncbi:MAG: hypothetical protein HQL17_03800 [Candidatus Omnitrophica bacterium]|nr:hypothetical protein [Candidatus Omnitrophota bacterium]